MSGTKESIRRMDVNGARSNIKTVAIIHVVLAVLVVVGVIIFSALSFSVGDATKAAGDSLNDIDSNSITAGYEVIGGVVGTFVMGLAWGVVLIFALAFGFAAIFCAVIAIVGFLCLGSQKRSFVAGRYDKGIKTLRGNAVFNIIVSSILVFIWIATMISGDLGVVFPVVMMVLPVLVDVLSVRAYSKLKS